MQELDLSAFQQYLNKILADWRGYYGDLNVPDCLIIDCGKYVYVLLQVWKTQPIECEIAVFCVKASAEDIRKVLEKALAEHYEEAIAGMDWESPIEVAKACKLCERILSGLLDLMEQEILHVEDEPPCIVMCLDAPLSVFWSSESA